MNNKISIKEAKQIRENLNLTHLIIFGLYEDGNGCVATHGKTTFDAKQTAELGNKLKEKLNWPDCLCHSTPLERICEHCSYWKIREYHFSERIPTNLSKGFDGKCHYEPLIIERKSNDRACNNFEPNC